MTKTVSRKSSVQSMVQVQGSVPNSRSEPAGSSDIQGSGSLTDNQKAIRDGFLAGKKAANVAREIGVSGSYVSGQYRKIKAELEMAA